MLDDERLRRVGHNEALYRQVNERIEDLSRAFEAVTGAFEIICECGNLHCTEAISIAREVYEQTRADPTKFIIKPGHEIDDLERVIAHHAEYVIVEKTLPAARRVAAATDPRT